MSQKDFNQFSLIDLFHQEAENQTAVLTQGLLALERDPTGVALLEELMRAAHSLKGAARIVGIHAAVQVAHAMEDCFVAAQKGKIMLQAGAVDVLLRSVDLFSRIAQTPEAEISIWKNENACEIEQAVCAVNAITSGDSTVSEPSKSEVSTSASKPEEPKPQAAGNAKSDARVLRVDATNLNRLLGLAGESLVESRWLSPYAESLLRIKRQQAKLSQTMEALRESLAGQKLDEKATALLATTQQRPACKAWGSATGNWSCLRAVPRAFPTGSTARFSRAGCVRLQTGFKDFSGWPATWPGSLARKCRCISLANRLQWIATYWSAWNRRWDICCATRWTTGLRRRRNALAQESLAKALCAWKRAMWRGFS